MATKSEKRAASRPINERALLTREMAADYLSVGLTTFKRFVDEGAIKKVDLRGMPRYRRLDLDRLVDELHTAK